MKHQGFFAVGILALTVLPFNCALSEEEKWFHQTVVDSDVYLFNGDGYACRIFTPPKRMDQMDVEALDIRFGNSVLQQDIKFKKDGRIIEQHFLLHPPKQAHGPLDKEKTKAGYDIFAEKCLQHADTLPQEIKDLLKRKYFSVK